MEEGAVKVPPLWVKVPEMFSRFALLVNVAESPTEIFALAVIVALAALKRELPERMMLPIFSAPKTLNIALSCSCRVVVIECVLAPALKVEFPLIVRLPKLADPAEEYVALETTTLEAVT